MSKFNRQKNIEESISSQDSAPETIIKNDEYKVTALGGLYLRKDPPSDTSNCDGNAAGAPISCMNCGDTFTEIERKDKWSYGIYDGKFGWTCNIYLDKK